MKNNEELEQCHYLRVAHPSLVEQKSFIEIVMLFLSAKKGWMFPSSLKPTRWSRVLTLGGLTSMFNGPPPLKSVYVVSWPDLYSRPELHANLNFINGDYVVSVACAPGVMSNRPSRCGKIHALTSCYSFYFF